MSSKKQFEIKSKFQPTGDQPQAIDKLSYGIKSGRKHQVLLGATGTGKTFTIANVINNVQKPTLVLVHNKTLAAQLAAEFKEFFPSNAVGYFVSYYDYYQPEAYVPRTDTFIEKQSTINEEIEKYRNMATQSLMTRNDVLIVASVSCIYGLGSVSNYENLSFTIKVGTVFERRQLVNKLIDLQYERNDINLSRANFRVKGDTIDLFPPYEDTIYRIEFYGDEIDCIKKINSITGELISSKIFDLHIFPAKHYVTTRDVLKSRIPLIRKELEERYKYFEEKGLMVEAQRIRQRTNYDIEMLEEMGFCSGIENYSRILDGRLPGSPGSTLLDYFPDDYLLVVDESHMTIPQVRGMSGGDRSRKQTLVDHGFRLPSAMDNRPLNFLEFVKKTNQIIYVSATPSEYELVNAINDSINIGLTDEKLIKRRKELNLQNLIKKTQTPNLDGIKVEKLYNKVISNLNYNDYFLTGIAQQIIRPTGLLDPEIIIRPILGQVKNLEEELNKVIKKGQRALVLTLTKKMSEELTNYLKDQGFKVQYLHSDLDAIERVDILKALRKGEFDIVVGINLLREGLDLPEVSLVAILDADKEGFLRNQTSLIQTIGRAARHVDGRVILYADYETESIKFAVNETERRRNIQIKYNKENNITPTPLQKEILEQLTRTVINDPKEKKKNSQYSKTITNLTTSEIKTKIKEYTRLMKESADELEFYKAADYRDKILELKQLYNEIK